MARHMSMFTSRLVYSVYVCRYQGSILRETIKGATTMCDRIGPPTYFYVERRVRHRKRSSSPRCAFCRGALFLLIVPLSSYPKDFKAHLLGKLPCFGLLPRLTNYQSESALSLFCTSIRHKHMTNLISSRGFGAFFSSRKYEIMRVLMIKACHISNDLALYDRNFIVFYLLG